MAAMVCLTFDEWYTVFDKPTSSASDPHQTNISIASAESCLLESSPLCSIFIKAPSFGDALTFLQRRPSWSASSLPSSSRSTVFHLRCIRRVWFDQAINSPPEIHQSGVVWWVEMASWPSSNDDWPSISLTRLHPNRQYFISIGLAESGLVKPSTFRTSPIKAPSPGDALTFLLAPPILIWIDDLSSLSHPPSLV